jgi:oligopeptide transport system substrate-binding protein
MSLPAAMSALAILITIGLGSSLAGPTFAQSATPQAREVVVIEAVDEIYTASPSGEQTLRITGPVDAIQSFDPALARDYSSAFFARQMFRGLVHLDADLQPQPELAGRIEISPDGLTYRFTLRDGAAFHDGTPIAARHVVGSLTRALDPDTAGGRLALLAGPSYLGDIAGAREVIENRSDTLSGVTEIDERTIEIQLDRPRATFLMKLAAAPGAIVDIDQASANPDWWRQPNGSGPFMMAEWTPGELLVLSPFNSFVAGVPVLQRVEIRLGPSAANAFNLYQSGQIDLTGVPVTAVDRVLDPGEGISGELSIVPVFSISFIAFRTDTEPIDDPAVREALIRAFPRQQLVDVTFNGTKLPAEGLLPPGLLERDWPVTGTEYDLDAAREVLARSRYPLDDFPPIRIYGASPFAAETLRDTIAETLGLEIQVISLEWPEFAAALVQEPMPAYEFTWIADYPDPETFLWSLFGSDSPDNYTGYANAEFDALLSEAALTLDPEARADIYLRAQQVLFDDMVALPIIHDIRYTISAPAVQGLEVTSLGIQELDSIWMER